MGAFHHQQIVLRGDLQFALRETGNSNRNAIVVFVNQFNVVRRIAVALALVVF
ncbi:Uncharacterised protein [Enterobacter cloacae]|nr:Uncharacterised protein [Enterobacter cloacae]